MTEWCRPAPAAWQRGFETTAPLAWGAYWKGGPQVTVPPGFAFDVSVPRWLHWWADPHDPRYRRAACLHDYALSRGARRVAGLMSESDVAVYRTGILWVGEMRTAWRHIAKNGLDPADDANWPPVPEGVAELAGRF